MTDAIIGPLQALRSCLSEKLKPYHAFVALASLSLVLGSDIFEANSRCRAAA